MTVFWLGTYIKPTITGYKCNEESDTLENDKCIITRTDRANEEFGCEEGYTLVERDICINYNDKVSKVDGYYCKDKKAVLKGEQCVIYEDVEAKSY